jgi:hypothetical protein
MEVGAFMNARVRVFSSWLVVFCFLFATLHPDDALAFFDTDTLKTTGIIMGITFGVALVIVLVVGTVRDLKKDRNDDDVWSQSPVLRTLGYRPGDFPLLGRPPLPAEGPADGVLVSADEIDLFLKAKDDGIRIESPPHRLVLDPHGLGLGPAPNELTLSIPRTDQVRIRPPFSLWQAIDQS